MTLEDFLDERIEEYHTANVLNSCGCGNPNSRPPCDFCLNGYSLTLAEYIEICTQEYNDTYGNIVDVIDPHEQFDRAIKDLF